MDEDSKATCVSRGFALFFLALGLCVAYWLWPDGITDQPQARFESRWYREGRAYSKF